MEKEHPAFIYNFTVLEGHLDSFGHMNNATYLELFEEARWDLITKRGFGYREVHQTGLGPTILEINLKFKREITLREQVRIETCLISYEGKLGRLRQTMFKEANQAACVMEMVFGLFDIKKRKLIEPTPEWKYAVGIE